jgi:hypothetical protein
MRLYFLKEEHMLKHLAVLLMTVHCSTWVYAEQATDQLLATLHQPQPKYVMRDEDYRLDPKMLKSSHVVGWVDPPMVQLETADFKGYRRAFDVNMTVVAATGRIAAVDVLRSSGAKAVDQKIKEALLKASLERIRYADANATYILNQKFEVEKPR